MELGTADATGRRRPLPVEGSEHLVEVEDVIVAVGQRPQLDWLAKEMPKSVSGSGGDTKLRGCVAILTENASSS